MAVNKFIKDAIDMAKSLQDFVDSINTYRFTMDDINDIAFFRPNINDTIQQIDSWINNDPVVIENGEPVEIEVPELVDPDTIKEEIEALQEEEPIKPPEKEVVEVSDEVIDTTEEFPAEEEPMGRPVKMTKNDYYTLGYFIAKECNADTVDNARKKAYAKFPVFSRLNVNRFVGKKTYIKDSDIFFTIDKGIIRASENYPCPTSEFEFQHIMDSMKDEKKFHDILGSMPESLWKPMLIDLARTSGNVGKIIELNPDISAIDLINIQTVKRAAVYGGFLASELSHLDMTILISDAVSKVGKKKIAKISNYVKKHWGVGNLRPETVFGVINKKDFPEICDKFFK